MTEDAPTRFFGFAQFDLAGTLPLADGRYVVRDGGEETVLVIETLGAPAPPRRRRRRARRVDPESTPATLPLTRATAVRAARSFDAEKAANNWLQAIAEDEQALDVLLVESAALLNRALHVHTVVSEDSHQAEISVERAAVARIGFGSGEQVAIGEWTAAREFDVRGGASRRQRRADTLLPQERTAAILGGRERLDACETLLLRARADLDAGRAREAALQLRIGFEALLVELTDGIDDPAHDEDMATLKSRRGEATAAADASLRGNLDATQLETVEELTALCERVLRRRRILRD